MKPFALTIATIASAIVAVADEGDKTLQYYVNQSELVAVVSIISVEALGVKEVGVQPYNCRVKVVEVLKGTPALATPEQVIGVYVERFETSPDDQLAILKAGSRCIVFLAPIGRSDSDQFRTVDMWFGVERYNSHMARSLKELAQPKKK